MTGPLVRLLHHLQQLAKQASIATAVPTAPAEKAKLNLVGDIMNQLKVGSQTPEALSKDLVPEGETLTASYEEAKAMYRSNQAVFSAIDPSVPAALLDSTFAELTRYAIAGKLCTANMCSM